MAWEARARRRGRGRGPGAAAVLAGVLKGCLVGTVAGGGAGGGAQPPHLLFVLVDDLGHGDAGWTYPAHEPPPAWVQTPNLDALAADGRVMDRHYVHYTCTPSRSSLQTGRFPVHVQTTLANPEQPNAGVPRNMTGIAAKLRDQGYKTHMVGKWDAGMASPDHTPRGRGYDTSLHYFSHKNDYFTQRAMQSDCSDPVESVGEFVDLWADDGPARTVNGTGYLEDIFAEEALRVVEGHDPEDPLFLFFAPHVAHVPLQVPEDRLQRFRALTKGDDERICASQTYYVNPTDGKNYACKAQYAAMVNYLDEHIGRIVEALKARGMWDSTLMVLSSDNGGPLKLVESAATNYPLRGGKYSPFEGGIRAAAFLSGGAIPAHLRGVPLRTTAHIADWYTTFCGLAGADPRDARAERSGLPPVDGVDLWPEISGRNPGPEALREIPVDNNTIIVGDYKLITGTPSVLFNVWTPPDFPNATSKDDPILHTLDCREGCLFDVAADPGEREDLASEPGFTPTVRHLEQRLAAHRPGFYSNDERGRDACPPGTPGLCACWAARHTWGGFLGPFQT